MFLWSSSYSLVQTLAVWCIVRPQCTASQTDRRHYHDNSWSYCCIWSAKMANVNRKISKCELHRPQLDNCTQLPDNAQRQVLYWLSDARTHPQWRHTHLQPSAETLRVTRRADQQAWHVNAAKDKNYWPLVTSFTKDTQVNKVIKCTLPVH